MDYHACFNLSIIHCFAFNSKPSSNGDNVTSSPYLCFKAKVNSLSANSGFFERKEPWKYEPNVFLYIHPSYPSSPLFP